MLEEEKQRKRTLRRKLKKEKLSRVTPRRFYI